MPPPTPTGPRIQLGLSNGFLLPHALVMAPDGARVYVINDYDQTISVVSTATNTVEDVWPTSLVGTAPRALAVSPDNRRLYVVGNHQLFIVIDIASRIEGGHRRAQSGRRVRRRRVARRVARLRHGDGVQPRGGAGHRAVRRHRAGAVATGSMPASDSLSVSPNGRLVYVPQRDDARVPTRFRRALDPAARGDSSTRPPAPS